MLQLLAVRQPPVSSDVLGSEELDIYGYVGKATARFKTGATARDIASSVNALESKTGVYANASTHARLPFNQTIPLTNLQLFLLIFME